MIKTVWRCIESGRMWKFIWKSENVCVLKRCPSSPAYGKSVGMWFIVCGVVAESLGHPQIFATPWTASTPSFPVPHYLPELTQLHVHWVSDAIQPSHRLSSPSPPAFNLSQHQGLFQWVSSSHQMAKVLAKDAASASVLPMNIQDWSPLGLTGLISL